MKWIINEVDTKTLKECEHGYKGGENSYHLEGDVYTHTSMVFNEIKKLTDDKILLAAAQLHDLGKPLARHEKNERTYFSGHEGISAYLSLNYAKEYNLNPKELFKLVALHGVLYRFPRKEMIEKSFNYDFWKKLSTLIKADHLGRITTKKSDIVELLDDEYDFTPKEKPKNSYLDSLNIEKKSLVILIGPPNSGKSTYIKKYLKEYKVLSRDNLVLEFAKKHKFKKHSSYNDAFNYLTREQHLKINEKLDVVYRDYINDRENVVIDMTNMSPKSRRRWGHMVKSRDYTIKFVLFLTSFDKIMDRNKNRKNKYIPPKDIIMFMNKFTYPLPYKEKYDELELIVDEDLC